MSGLRSARTPVVLLRASVMFWLTVIPREISCHRKVLTDPKIGNARNNDHEHSGTITTKILKELWGLWLELILDKIDVPLRFAILFSITQSHCDKACLCRFQRFTFTSGMAAVTRFFHIFLGAFSFFHQKGSSTKSS